MSLKRRHTVFMAVHLQFRYGHLKFSVKCVKLFPRNLKVLEKLDVADEIEASQPNLQWFWQTNWLQQLENDFRVDSKSKKSATPVSEQKSSSVVQKNYVAMEVKETNKRAKCQVMSMKYKMNYEHANSVEDKTALSCSACKGKRLGYIDNLISFIEDKFNCLDKRLKKIEEKVQKIDSLEENTGDVREMREQVNKIVDLVEFLNSADYNVKLLIFAAVQIPTTFDDNPSIATPATVFPSFTTNAGIVKEDPIIIPSTQQEVKKYERKRRSRKDAAVLRTPYTNPFRKSRHVNVDEAKQQVQFEHWLKEDNMEPKILSWPMHKATKNFFRSLYDADAWLNGGHIDVGCYVIRYDLAKLTMPHLHQCAIMDSVFQQKLLLKYELFKKDPTTIWDEDQEHDLTIKQANGEDLPFAIPWRDVYKVNGDCGVFVLRYLDTLARGEDIQTNCTQAHVSSYRKQLAERLFYDQSLLSKNN
ncbi:hypothetical protein WN944_015751 [Citrus x changshan-huyou]|uniref:Uncharacterized protein n=1 Tax=Citrus x changshan-huyou TaxID=2935761 RepID=A0AAP0QJT8_9ROSI